jgi:hypothetical protein
MDDPLFLRGRHNPQEGGPKGLDIHKRLSVLAVTSEHQPLAFFDLAVMLDSVPSAPPVLDVEYEFGILEHAAHLQARARLAEAHAAKAKARLRAAKKAGFRRIAKPLRRAYFALLGSK